MLSYCYQLENVEIPASVQELSQGVFYHNEKLKSISLPEGITFIPLYQFTGCVSLVDVNLPSTLTKIDYEVFNGCTALQSIILPAKLESIGRSAFSGCTAMTSVYSLNPVPPAIESSTWDGVTANATLYVPSDEAVTAYEVASYWSNFKSIEKMAEGLPCAQPSFSFADYKLTMVTQTEGATIYYTNDDSDPTVSDTRTLYTEPIDFWKNDTIRAVAVKVGMSPSPIGTFIRNDFKVASPEVSISDDLVITITTEEPVPVSTQFFYVYADGSSWPNQPSRTVQDILAKCTLYDTEFRPTKPGHMYVIALREGWIMSDWVSFDYYSGFGLDVPTINTDQSKRAVTFTHSSEGVVPQMSNETERHFYNIRNANNTDYYVVVSLAPTAGNPVQLGSSNTETPAVFVLRDGEYSRKDIYVVIDNKEYPIAATCNSPSDNSVKAYYSMSDVETDWLAEWYVENQGDNTFIIKTPENSVSWNQYGGAGENIGLYYTYDRASCWSFMSLEGNNDEKAVRMYYTLDGSTPTTESTLYTDTIFLTENCTVKAIATKFRRFNSDVKEQAFSWFRVAKPTITFSAITVTIDCEEPCDTIFYTLDNTTPTHESMIYTKPFTLDKNCTIRAMGVHTNWTDSEVAVKTYYSSEHTCKTPTFNSVSDQKKDSLLVISSET